MLVLNPVLPTGRPGGQTVAGGTAASENLTLTSTNHATKNLINLGSAGTSVFDELNQRLGIANAAPAAGKRIDIGDTNTNAVEAVRITNSNNTAGASVGAAFQAIGAAGANINFTMNGVNRTGTLFGVNLANLAAMASSGSTGFAIGPSDNTFLLFGTNNLERMRITGTDIVVQSATATPAGGSTTARLLFGTTAGFGIYYGSGAPTVSAAQGSIYIRSDGNSTSTRLYVNTNGTTGWTNFTSAA
jgi:hypothetical protein